jgi:N-acetylglutamate synthase
MGHSVKPFRAELSADATWPAQENFPLGPWRLRATQGYSRRANSVRTAGEPGGDLDWLDLIAKAEAFYRQRDLPPMFHISPASVPSDLDKLLAERGYQTVMNSQVWSGDPAEVRNAMIVPRPAGQMVIREEPDDAWLRCALDEYIGRVEIRSQICRRVPKPRAFAAIMLANEPVARALSAVYDGIGWLYCMATVAEQQRRGFAAWLLHDLAQWVMDTGAETFYLQVLKDNSAAKALYSKAGFEKRYEYHYRVRK